MKTIFTKRAVLNCFFLRLQTFRNAMVLLICLSSADFVRAELRVYSAPAEAPQNNDYRIQVRQGGGSWLEVFEYKALVYRGKAPAGSSCDVFPYQTDNSTMAYFDFNGTVEVRLLKNSGTISSVQVHPLRHGIAPVISGNYITFSLAKARNLSIVVNGDWQRNIQLFANPWHVIPSPSSVTHYFGPGFHQIGDGTGSPGNRLVLASGDKVYIHGGALIKGSIYGDNVSNITIQGSGVLWGENANHCNLSLCDCPETVRYRTLQIGRGSNLNIDGIILLDPGHHGFQIGSFSDVTLRNVKQISYAVNTDGINLIGVSDAVVEDCYIRTGDDCLAPKSDHFGYRADSRNHIYRNMVLHHTGTGRPVLVGVEDWTGVMEDLTFDNIDVVRMGPYTFSGSNGIVISARQGATIRDIIFNDFRIHGGGLNRAVFFEMIQNAGQVRDITFRNFSANNQSIESYLQGKSSTNTVNGVIFQNVRINNTLVARKSAGLLNWNNNVFNVSFSSNPLPNPLKWYFIKNKGNNFVCEASTAPGSLIYMWDQGEVDRRKWQFVASAGAYNIKNKASGLVAEVASARGRQLFMASQTATSAKQWSLIPSGDHFFIKNRGNGYVAEVGANKTDKVYVWDQGINDRRLWSLVESSGSTIGRLAFEGSEGALMEEQGVEDDIRVYPNPATDKVEIDYSSKSSGTALIRVVDVRGKIVDQVQGINGRAQLNSQQYAPSVYILLIEIENQQIVKKFLRL